MEYVGKLGLASFSSITWLIGINMPCLYCTLQLLLLSSSH
jgi:hypothetical protein